MQTFQFSLEISNPEDLALFKALAERLGYEPEVEEHSTYDPLEDYVLPKNPFSTVIDYTKGYPNGEELAPYEQDAEHTEVPEATPVDMKALDEELRKNEEQFPEVGDDDAFFDEIEKQLAEAKAPPRRPVSFLPHQDYGTIANPIPEQPLLTPEEAEALREQNALRYGEEEKDEPETLERQLREYKKS